MLKVSEIGGDTMLRLVWWGVCDRATGDLIAVFPDRIDAETWHKPALHRIPKDGTVQLVEDTTGDGWFTIHWRDHPIALAAAFRSPEAATAFVDEQRHVLHRTHLRVVPRNEWDEC